MSVEERARLIIDPDTEKAIRALLAVIDTEKKVGDEAKSVANKREQIEAEFSKKAFDLSHNRVEILKKEFAESLAEAERYGAKRESIEKYYNKAINDARADALAAQGQKLASVGGALTLGMTTPLLAAGAAGLKFAASMESSAVKYGVLLRDMSKGIPFTEELKALAAQTPLAFQGLDQAAQTLLGFQVSSDGLTDTLRMLGDLAKGSNEKLQGVALAYGQMSAAGRANMQDLNQLINAGVPILGALATSMGKPIPEIRKMVEEGKVGFSDVDKALKGLVSEGGLFHDMMKRVAETAEGKLSTSLDSLKNAAGAAMESLIPLVKDILDGVTGAAEKFAALDEGSRRAILAMLGMAAAAGPILTTTGGVMQLVAAYQKLDKVALAAKLTILASSPVGWAIAAGAAIAGGIALINKAEREHEQALKDKIGAYQQNQVEGAKLAKEYQTLHDKTKLSADEQKRMGDLAQILKDKYPGLTQDTLDLAAANKVLAGEVGKAGEAQGKQNLEAFLAEKNKDLLAASRSWSAADRLAKGSKDNPLQQGLYQRALADMEYYKKEMLRIEAEMQKARDDFYFPKAPSSSPTVTPPPGGGADGTVTMPKQGDRLAALDREYGARVALAKKLGEDVYAVEEEWAKKKFDMLQGFVLEDVKNGKTVEESLLSTLSTGYGKLGELIAAAYKKALAAGNEYTEAEKRRISEQQVAAAALQADADKIQGLWQQTAEATKLADDETLKFIESQLAAAKASDENGDAVYKLTAILNMLKAKNEELTEAEKRRISEQQVAAAALQADADKIQGLWQQTAEATKLADDETLKFIESQLAAAKASDENGDAVYKLTAILNMLKAKNEELTEAEKRRISEQQVAAAALQADADKIQGLWQQTAEATKLADDETLKFIESQLAAAKASDENGDAVYKLTAILSMLKAKNEELTEAEKRRIAEQQVAAAALQADADKIQGLWQQTAEATKLADAETLRFVEGQLAAAKASDENGDAVYKLTAILSMLKAKNEELTEAEKRRIAEQQVAAAALQADADKIQGLWQQTAEATKLADAETLRFVEGQLAAAKASDENGDAVYKLTAILSMLKAKNEELTEAEKRRIAEQQVAAAALQADADKIQGLWQQTAEATKLADAETLRFVEGQLAAAKASDENGDAVYKLTAILSMLKAKNEELTEAEKRRIAEQQVAAAALQADADKIQGLWQQTAEATKLADAETLRFVEGQLAAAKASDENGDAVYKLTAILDMLREKAKIDLSQMFGDIGGQTGTILRSFATLSNGLEAKYKITLISDPAKEKLKAFVKDNKEGLQELAAVGERLLGEMFDSIKDNAAVALKEELAGIDDRIEAYEKSSSRQLDLLRKNGADTVAFELQMNAKKERLDKEKAAKEYAIGKKEFEVEKASKLAEIAMATSLGIAKAWANPVTAPWVSAIIGGVGLAQAAIVASQKYPAAYEGAYVPGSPMGTIVRTGERHQDEIILPLRKSKLEELGLSGQTSGNFYIEKVEFVLPEGTSRDQALAMLEAFKGLKREGLLKGLVA